MLVKSSGLFLVLVMGSSGLRPLGLRLVSMLSGVVVMCRCLEYVMMIVKLKMIVIWLSRKNVSMFWLYAPSSSSLAMR